MPRPAGVFELSLPVSTIFPEHSSAQQLPAPNLAALRVPKDSTPNSSGRHTRSSTTQGHCGTLPFQLGAQSSLEGNVFSLLACLPHWCVLSGGTRSVPGNLTGRFPHTPQFSICLGGSPTRWKSGGWSRDSVGMPAGQLWGSQLRWAVSRVWAPRNHHPAC